LPPKATPLYPGVPPPSKPIFLTFFLRFFLFSNNPTPLYVSLILFLILPQFFCSFFCLNCLLFGLGCCEDPPPGMCLKPELGFCLWPSNVGSSLSDPAPAGFFPLVFGREGPLHRFFFFFFERRSTIPLLQFQLLLALAPRVIFFFLFGASVHVLDIRSSPTPNLIALPTLND